MPDRVLIVGAGIAGLTLANALRPAAVRVELVERSATWPTAGAAITMHANGVRVLHRLGFGDAIARVSHALPRWRFCTPAGEELCNTDLQDLWGDVGPCLGVTRVRLQQVLLAAVAQGDQMLRARYAPLAAAP